MDADLLGFIYTWAIPGTIAILFLFRRWKRSREGDSWYLVLLSFVITVISVIAGTFILLLVLAYLWFN